MLSQDATLLSLIERPVSCGTQTAEYSLSDAMVVFSPGFKKGQNGPAAEVMQEAAMHTNRRVSGVDQSIAVVHIGIEKGHCHIEISDLLSAFSGDEKTVSTEPIGWMGGGEQVSGRVPIRSGVVVLVGLVVIFQAQIGVSFLETVGGR